jgi:hypothetical protein
VILENCVIRTLEPSLPVMRAVAIAGDRIAGGVAHETALPSPRAGRPRFCFGRKQRAEGSTSSATRLPTTVSFAELRS